MKNLSGMRFGRLTALELADPYIRKDGRKEPRWRCLCDCGNVSVHHQTSIESGIAKSCGCLHKERSRLASTKHGMSNTREFRIWRGMIDRCHNEKTPTYKHYGARGICVCDRWRESFVNFYEDMGPSNGLSIERVDNNKGYEPSNCKWATVYEQAQNRRINPPRGERNVLAKLTEKQVLEIRERRAKGENGVLLAKEFGVSHSLIYRVSNRKAWSHI